MNHQTEIPGILEVRKPLYSSKQAQLQKIAAVKAKHAALKQASLASSHHFRFPCINHHVVAPRHQRTD